MKGGIFFWLGLFTLGRWSGSFGELGWAWNIKPKESKKWRPSAEFVESFLIFFYGSTNIFLEHIGNWGGEWAPQDLEHISITVLFIGGGLVSGHTHTHTHTKTGGEDVKLLAGSQLLCICPVTIFPGGSVHVS